MTLQCPVLADSLNKTCPEEHGVYLFRAGSHQSNTSFNHTQGNSVEEYEKNPEGHSTKKCVYSFFEKISSSDAGTYYCAVATCEEISSGNRSKPDPEGNCIIFNEEMCIFVCLIRIKYLFLMYHNIINHILLLITLLLIVTLYYFVLFILCQQSTCGILRGTVQFSLCYVLLWL